MLLLPNTAAKARGHRGQGLGGREEKPQDFKADYAPRNGQEKARSHARHRPKFQLKQKGHPFPVTSFPHPRWTRGLLLLLSQEHEGGRRVSIPEAFGMST